MINQHMTGVMMEYDVERGGKKVLLSRNSLSPIIMSKIVRPLSVAERRLFVGSGLIALLGSVGGVPLVGISLICKWDCQ